MCLWLPILQAWCHDLACAACTAQMFFDDDLPVWGFIGKTENKPGADGKPQSRQFLFTHFHFDIGYNGNQVSTGLVSAASAGRGPSSFITVPAATSLCQQLHWQR